MGCKLTAVFKTKKERDLVHKFLNQHFRPFNKITPPLKIDMEGFNLYSQTKDFTIEKNTGISFGMSAWTNAMEREYALSILSWVAFKANTLRGVSKFKGGECNFSSYLELPGTPTKSVPYFLYDNEPWPVLDGTTWGDFMSKHNPEGRTVNSLGIRLNQDGSPTLKFFLKKEQISKLYTSIQLEIERLDKLFKEEFLK